VPYVLDASIAACWCFHDEQDARADIAFELLDRDFAVVPAHWWFEVRNITLVGERRGRVLQIDASLFLGRLERMTITHADLPDGSAVLELARRRRLSFYDAAYLELAQRESIALATLDNDLCVAARAEGVALIE
jgi:predicted nucleic acid-binding protein